MAAADPGFHVGGGQWFLRDLDVAAAFPIVPSPGGIVVRCFWVWILRRAQAKR